MRRLLKAETRMCGIIRKSTAVQTWETTGSLLHFAISSLLRVECIVFLSEQIRDSLVSLILGATLNSYKGQSVDSLCSFAVLPNIQMTDLLSGHD